MPEGLKLLATIWNSGSLDTVLEFIATATATRRPTPDLSNQKLWGLEAATCVLTSPLSDSDVLKFESHCFRDTQSYVVVLNQN